MRSNRTCFFLHALCFGVFLMVCSRPASARNGTTATHMVESKLRGNTILNASQSELISTVRECIEQNPAQAGYIVRAVLGGGRADADAMAPKVAAAAIEGLGTPPATASVTEIVYAAVKTAPAVVLETVRAAVKAAPGSAKAIVRAAVKAVPNPSEKIAPVGELLDDGLSKDAKDMPDYRTTDNAGNLVPIGEAIAKAAQQGDPRLSLTDLLTTVNQALTESRTGNNFTNTSTYQGYYYPPLVDGNVRSDAPSALPTPAVVSQ